ncbi:hypothetical protein H072_1535 [Dactylellina haptotyla CBS 200.50]|uniref:Uncharacterized protein n=1 Tax=Dactylellina haptotyla (strain CBS 200.50) TaxID=1284197 RepID=S8CA04_DACHA|nr:hypothetical protein H072_1535 [Dactylellina haptotyla CBS 200.50]
MATVTSTVLTVPDFDRPIRILNRDPSRPPSSHSLHRSMSEESLNKVTVPITREVPHFFNMPPSPAKTPTNCSSEQLPLAPNSAPVAPVDQILPPRDINVSVTNIHKTISASKEDDSPVSSKEELDEYIQQTADALSSTVKDLQALQLSESGGLEHMIAANLRLLRTLKDRHAALDKVEHEVRNDRSRSAGPYTSINRSIYFDTPDYTPPQTSRITFRNTTSRRNSDDMDGLSTISIEWNDKKEERLAELRLKLKDANLAWSEKQNDYLEELEQLQEERRKHKKKAKMERRASIKMERSLSMSHEREREPQSSSSSSRERASSADTKRRLSLGFGPKPMARTNSSGSFIERLFNRK